MPSSEPFDRLTLNFAERREDQVGPQGIALAGLAGFCAAWLIMAGLHIHKLALLIILFLLLTALPMVLISLLWNKTYLRSSTGLRDYPGRINLQRCLVKFIGFLATILFLCLFYKIVPEYSRSFYHPVWTAFAWLALPVLGLSFPYILWVDGRMANPEDSCWNAGMFVLGRWRKVNYRELRLYAVGWFIKGFFLPFMLAGGAEHLEILPTVGLNVSNYDHLYASFINFAYTLDIFLGAAGYFLTLRILDSHIQSVEKTALGWLSAICCYVPFSTIIWSSLLNYKGKTDWSAWLAPYPILFISWGFVIMALTGIYVWSTCSFGVRFSNLTNRGIITEGPYRYFKHPAYLSKNIAWWMMSVPFISQHNALDAIRACICLLLTNFIYGIRAWTEERHLLRDPAYQAYYDWMEKNGAGAQFRRLWVRLRAKRIALQ